MAAPRRKNQKKPKTTKKKAAKRQTYRDIQQAPTAKQIEASISRGTSIPLTEFDALVKY